MAWQALSVALAAGQLHVANELLGFMLVKKGAPPPIFTADQVRIRWSVWCMWCMWILNMPIWATSDSLACLTKCCLHCVCLLASTFVADLHSQVERVVRMWAIDPTHHSLGPEDRVRLDDLFTLLVHRLVLCTRLSSHRSPHQRRPTDASLRTARPLHPPLFHTDHLTC